ncbi:hypothetical protein BJ875DRAFT_525718 [Amylocarpus encephaloides]|uniref:Uncharacterized protein n=1 Tax=Amylocarpus encephaloides TaxID=45428 RepID=A0A9P7YMK9_9HELO|nr:hypothetical protein BJ875DRAFT_525718 [Amylocarpus encephaloides]
MALLTLHPVASLSAMIHKDGCCATVNLASCSDDDFMGKRCKSNGQVARDSITSRGIPTFEPNSVASVLSEAFRTITTLVPTPTSFSTFTLTDHSLLASNPLATALPASIISAAAKHEDLTTTTLHSMTVTSILTVLGPEIVGTPWITRSASSASLFLSETTESVLASGTSESTAKSSPTHKLSLSPSIIAVITSATLSVVGLVVVAALCFRRRQLRRNEDKVTYMMQLPAMEALNGKTSDSQRPVITGGMKISAPIRVRKETRDGQWVDGIGDMSTRSI